MGRAHRQGAAARLAVGATVVAAVAGLMATGCDGNDAAITYYRDVKPLLDANCVRCHHDGGIAPMPLTTYDEVFDFSGKIQEKVTMRIMPPWLAGQGCRDYLADRSLTDEEIATISGWVDLGSPKGHKRDEPPPLPPEEDNALSHVDLTFDMPEPYTPVLTPDDYRCFLLDWPEEATTYITGFRARPGTPEIVHHVIAFAAAPNQVAGYEALDAAETGPGWTCFGGPGRIVNDMGQDDEAFTWAGAWAPGSEGTDYPAGTGLKVEPGSKIIMQVHYNTSSTDPVADISSLDFKLDASVMKEAFVLPFTDFWDWIVQDDMFIPAGEADVMYSYESNVNDYLGIGFPLGYTVYSAGFHMHTRGNVGKLEVHHADGSSECLLDVPRWDFHWQMAYGFSEPVDLLPSDALYIECHWDNSPDNQPMGLDGRPIMPEDLWWGEGTSDEMCLGIFYMTLL
jgi:hypothetical protein